MAEGNYEFLLDKKITEILNGDIDCGKYTTESGIEISAIMPRLSGKDLCNLSNKFGLEVEYNFREALSRWQYLYNLLDFCIKNNTCQDLLSYMFSIERFNNILKECRVNEIKSSHQEIVSIIVQEINKLLLYKGYELKNFNDIFYIQTANDNVITKIPNIVGVGKKFIKDLVERAKNDIENKNYESAITKSRTIIEETLCFMIEEKGEIPSDKGDIGKLLKQFFNSYNFQINNDSDEPYKRLISGLKTVVLAIAEIRNKMSDSHGVGSKRVELTREYAQFALNASISISEFILSFKEEKCEAHYTATREEISKDMNQN